MPFDEHHEDDGGDGGRKHDDLPNYVNAQWQTFALGCELNCKCKRCVSLMFAARCIAEHIFQEDMFVIVHKEETETTMSGCMEVGGPKLEGLMIEVEDLAKAMAGEMQANWLREQGAEVSVSDKKGEPL